MPRFFLDKDAFLNETVTIAGEDASHIALSLRMAIGQTLTLSDKDGFDYKAEIIGILPNAVTLTVLDKTPSLSEPPYAATLFQCLPKGDKFETVIQKAVECGVSAIVPVASSRCIAVVKADALDKKLARWNKIAAEAAKQSGRGRLVTVRAPLSYQDALAEMMKSDCRFLCYENEDGLTLSSFLPKREEGPKNLSFLIGPEGGLSEGEVLSAKERGISAVSLGRRILRTETASGFVLAALSARYEL